MALSLPDSVHLHQSHRLLWQIDSPYFAAADFTEGEYFSPNHMDKTGCLKALSINILYSNLLTLRRSAPAPFWTLYELALDRHHPQGGTPEDFTILFITADTHVPWELMPVSEKVIGEKMPPLLGSAHRVGRWLLEVGAPAPDAKLDLHGFSVSATTYKENPLPQAQAEKKFIEQHYGPHVLPDDANAFIAFMKTGQPKNGTGILHFAGHGDCCTDVCNTSDREVV